MVDRQAVIDNVKPSGAPDGFFFSVQAPSRKARGMSARAAHAASVCSAPSKRRVIQFTP